MLYACAWYECRLCTALQLVEVINEDYADFVSLSTKLVNVDGAVLRMQKPLQELRVTPAALLQRPPRGKSLLIIKLQRCRARVVCPVLPVADVDCTITNTVQNSSEPEGTRSSAAASEHTTCK